MTEKPAETNPKMLVFLSHTHYFRVELDHETSKFIVVKHANLKLLKDGNAYRSGNYFQDADSAQSVADYINYLMSKNTE